MNEGIFKTCNPQSSAEAEVWIEGQDLTSQEVTALTPLSAVVGLESVQQ